jgi:hypothetical protein
MKTEENNVVLFGSEHPTPFRPPDFSLSISSLCAGITSLAVQADGRGGWSQTRSQQKSVSLLQYIPYLAIPSYFPISEHNHDFFGEDHDCGFASL